MKMKFMHLVKIALLLVSPGVFAATIEAESIDGGLDLISSDGILFNVEIVKAGEFSSSYGFKSEGEASIFISTSSLEHSLSMPAPVGDIDVYSIAGLTATLKQGAVVLESGSAFASSIAAGSYVIEVTGDATGLAGGTYSVGVAPVPLPPAMLLMGSAVVGLTAVGRRNKKVLKST